MIEDPMMRRADGLEDSPLFGTRHAAWRVAAVSSTGRRAKILKLLENGPMALFEIAAEMNVFDHQISGRITDLKADGLIERTGQAKRKPETGCLCDVYRLAEVEGGR